MTKAKVEQRLKEIPKITGTTSLVQKTPLVSEKKGPILVGPGKDGEFTPALLKAKFAGRAAFNKKTGELTLYYDFTNINQLKDFDLKDGKPQLVPGNLRLPPGEAIKHTVQFKAVTVACDVLIENIGSAFKKHQFMRFTNSNIGTNGRNGDWGGLYLQAEGKFIGEKAAINFKKIQGKFLHVIYSVTPRRVNAKIGGSEFGGPVNLDRAGQLWLFGGVGGVHYRNLVLAGQPEEEWTKEFLGK